MSILLHPNFAALRDKYGGQVLDGTVNWPATLPAGGGGDSAAAVFDALSGGARALAVAIVANALSAGSGGKPPPQNPLFGVSDFLRMEGTYSHRYLSFNPPSAVSKHVGKVFETGSLPGRPPYYPQLAPCAHTLPEAGTVFEIAESYWLSGEGGWPAPIYPKANSTEVQMGLGDVSVEGASIQGA